MSSPSDSDEDALPQDSHWNSTHGQNPTSSLSPALASTPYAPANVDGQASAKPITSIPLQKRRRVTRACDECRRKKIKCDGKQPCTHCTVYSYECTYDQPSNRRRNPAPQYIEALETRVQQLQALLKIVLPDVDLDSPTFDLEKVSQLQKLVDAKTNKDSKSYQSIEGAVTPSTDALLESMVEAAGRLDIDETGQLDFHGHSSGFTFLNKLRDQFKDLLGGSNGLLKFNVLPSGPVSDEAKLVYSPKAVGNTPQESNSGKPLLLPRQPIAEILVNDCLNEACILMRFIHQPSFDAMFKRIYMVHPDDFGKEENRFLPLLYLSLAVGCIFTSRTDELGFQNGVTEGIKYFHAGRQMIDITDCRNSTSIQCVLLMILFLQSTAKMSTCYSYVAIALSASLRMGLHRKIEVADPIEGEVRRRIFWTIRKLGIYVGTLLGLPKGIQDEDIDQGLPTEVDDQYITSDGIIGTPGEEPSSIAAANAHTKLLKVLDKVGKMIYPIKGLQISDDARSDSYMVSYASVKEIEEDLDKWQKELPSYLHPGDDAPVRFVRSQHLLRMSYAHVKMMLYRPFLHYVGRSRNRPLRDERPYASAAECINTSREIIHICISMQKKGILNGAYWFNIYTTFFAVISLVYFVLENMSDANAPAILQEATLGMECIMSLQDNSVAAERCGIALKTLFDQLPTTLDTVHRNEYESSNRKKRTRGASPLPPMPDVQSPDGSVTISENSSTTLLKSNILTSSHDTTEHRSLLDFGTEYLLKDIPFNSPTIQAATFHQSQGGTGNVPNINTLIYPTASSFAYSNQASKLESMSQFASHINHTIHSPSSSYNNKSNDNNPSIRSQSNMNISNNSPYDILEAQFAGPLPPYAYQGQQVSHQYESGLLHIPNEMEVQNNLSFPQYHNNGQLKMADFPMNLDSLFSAGLEETEWDDILNQNNQRRQ